MSRLPFDVVPATRQNTWQITVSRTQKAGHSREPQQKPTQWNGAMKDHHLINKDSPVAVQLATTAQQAPITRGKAPMQGRENKDIKKLQSKEHQPTEKQGPYTPETKAPDQEGEKKGFEHSPSPPTKQGSSATYRFSESRQHHLHQQGSKICRPLLLNPPTSPPKPAGPTWQRKSKRSWKSWKSSKPSWMRKCTVMKIWKKVNCKNQSHHSKTSKKNGLKSPRKKANHPSGHWPTARNWHQTLFQICVVFAFSCMLSLCVYSCQPGFEGHSGRKRRITTWEYPSLGSAGQFPQINDSIIYFCISFP